jgi:prepilin-type N-terminal cleavage/methylation domain-containing protein
MNAEGTPRSGGFTLLEVVVALAIAAVALVGLFQAGSGGFFAVDTAARAQEAVQRAQSHLAAVGRDAALVQGDFTDEDGGGYRWHLSVRPAATRQLPAAGGNANTTETLFDVEVAISWPGHSGDRSVVLKTLRLGSAATGGLTP